MKKFISFPILFCILSLSLFAQENHKPFNDFNKWYIEGDVGFTKPFKSFSNGYWSPDVGLLASDIGVRYMFNEYFGLKLNLGMNQYNNAEKSREFDTEQYNLSLQGVVNGGRLLNFQSWTKTFNFLVHGGVGVGYIYYHEPTNSNDRDDVGVLIGGITGQIKISPRVSLTLDASGIGNFEQNHSFDGGTPNDYDLGIGFNGTIGLSISLGKNKKQADWYYRDMENLSSINSSISGLRSEVTKTNKAVENTETELEEIKTEVEEISQKLEKQPEERMQGISDEQFLQALIDNGYLNVYFDFNSAKVDKASLATINFLSNYMKSKPGMVVKLSGYADDLGSEAYNLKLSERRASEVRIYLTELGVANDRIVDSGEGEYKDGLKQSKTSRQMARRVSVEVFENIDDAKVSGIKTERKYTSANKIHFLANKDYITDYSKGRLDKLAEYLTEHPDHIVNMYSYTDNLENNSIAEKRLKAVSKYLKSKGVVDSQIGKTKSLGSSKPIATNDNDKGRLLNRRIEFEIVSSN